MSKTLLFATAVALTLPGVCGAADFDGSRNLLCVPTDANQCEGAGYCDRVEVESMNLSKFIDVDFGKRELRGRLEGQEDVKTTPIQSLEKLEGRMILQGAQDGRGWSLVIDGPTGDMTLAIAGDGMGFLLFGVCQPR